MKNETIEIIRKFNRFYTVAMGFLNNNYIEEFSVIEARILFELKNNPDCTQSYLVRALNVDKSYLSRIIKKFEKNTLVIKQINKSDMRAQNIKLTKKGYDTVCRLIEIVNNEIEQMILNLNNNEMEKLNAALNTVIQTLSKEKDYGNN